jgi:hypothetical protein
MIAKGHKKRKCVNYVIDFRIRPQYDSSLWIFCKM